MPPPTVLVTVGSTRFDALAEAARAAPFVRAVHEAVGAGAVLGVQYGHSAVPVPPDAQPCSMHGAQGHAYAAADGAVTVFLFRYAPSLAAWIRAATLVVAHGAGSRASRRRAGAPR